MECPPLVEITSVFNTAAQRQRSEPRELLPAEGAGSTCCRFLLSPTETVVSEQRLIDLPLKEFRFLFSSRLSHRKLLFEFLFQFVEFGQCGSLRFCLENLLTGHGDHEDTVCIFRQVQVTGKKRQLHQDALRRTTPDSYRTVFS